MRNEFLKIGISTKYVSWLNKWSTVYSRVLGYLQVDFPLTLASFTPN